MRKPKSEEAKKNMKEAAKKRRPVSEETKQKMRDSQKEFWSSDKSNLIPLKIGIVALEEIARITLFKFSMNKFLLIVNFIIASCFSGGFFISKYM